jgi:hypothetical protein
VFALDEWLHGEQWDVKVKVSLIASLQFCVIGNALEKDMRVRCSEDASCFEHSCSGGIGRDRSYRKQVVLAAPSPIKKMAAAMDSTNSIQEYVIAVGLPSISKQRAQRLVRERTSVSWEKFVLELHLLERFFAEARVIDPQGLYILEKGVDVYNQVEVTVFQRYFISWGIALDIVNEIPLLYFVCLDGCHLKNPFGGICLAAVVSLSNSKVFPIAWSVVESECDDSVLWFTKLVLDRFQDVDFVWMTDQGTALTSSEFERLLASKNQSHSYCANHMIKAIEIAARRKDGPIKGKMGGIRELIFSFAKSRTEDWGNAVIGKLRAANDTVADYLVARRGQLEAASFLDGRRRGGRITSQLVESFFNMVGPFRALGLVSGIVWMSNKFSGIFRDELSEVVKWTQPSQKKDPRLLVLSKKANEKFVSRVLRHVDEYVVKSWISASAVLLKAVVARNSDTEDTEEIVIKRESVGEHVVVVCGCKMREEFGFPCARAVRILLDANDWDVLRNQWNFSEAEYFAKFLWSKTWKEQVSLVVPDFSSAPLMQDSVWTNDPKKELRKTSKNSLDLFPNRITALAGRPKTRSRKPVDHFPRRKSFLELGSKRKSGKSNVYLNLDFVVTNLTRNYRDGKYG